VGVKSPSLNPPHPSPPPPAGRGPPAVAPPVTDMHPRQPRPPRYANRGRPAIRPTVPLGPHGCRGRVVLCHPAGMFRRWGRFHQRWRRRPRRMVLVQDRVGPRYGGVDSADWPADGLGGILPVRACGPAYRDSCGGNRRTGVRGKTSGTPTREHPTACRCGAKRRPTRYW